MTAHLAVEAAASKLPAGWAVESFRRLAVERGTRNSDLAEQSLSLSSTGLLYDRTEESDRQFASEQSARNAWVVLPGDLVVNPMWLFGGAIGVSDRRGAVSPDYRVYRLSPHLEPRFVHHLLRSSPYRDQYRLYMRAETTFDRRITKDDFGEMPLVSPPRQTQRAIAAYLDAETTQIDALAQRRRHQVALNAARRFEAVRAAMRGCGTPTGRLPWAPGVPSEWPVIHLRWLTTCLDGRRIPVNREDRASMQGDIPYWGANAVVDYVDTALFEEPLVLLGEDGAPFFDREKPKAFFVDTPVWVNNHIHVLRAHGIRPRFLMHYLNLVDYAEFVGGSTRDKLTQDDMGSIPVPVPPVSEQERIEQEISVSQRWVDEFEAATERQIELLTERRQALITAAVTGHLAIPGVAA